MHHRIYPIIHRVTVCEVQKSISIFLKIKIQEFRPIKFDPQNQLCYIIRIVAIKYWICLTCELVDVICLNIIECKTIKSKSTIESIYSDII